MDKELVVTDTELPDLPPVFATPKATRKRKTSGHVIAAGLTLAAADDMDQGEGHDSRRLSRGQLLLPSCE